MERHRNPVPTVDIILEEAGKLLMVRRRSEPFRGRLALPGGYINEGETAEAAAVREAKEETNVSIQPQAILGVYSDPDRDPRTHTLTTVFVGEIVSGLAKAGDDAASLEWIGPDRAKVEGDAFAFDHARIILDYIEWKTSSTTFWSTKPREK